MKPAVIAISICVVVMVTASVADASERDRPWCRHLEYSRDPMIWSEGFGVARCNDRALTPYQPWHSAVPLRRDQHDPMVAREDWHVNGFSDYDHRYDDHYDRRPHRYR
jgi:hypothetical protein